ncbi:outer membrane beta-barrel protein, partial [bacterium]|nr:outer membrane beta-barrel protein [bacterium]
MKPTLDRLVLLAVLLLLVSPSARADEDWGDYSLFTISPYAGTTIWSDDIGLDDKLIFGGRAAILFAPWLGVEGTYGYSKTERTLDAAETKVHHTGIDLVLNLMPRAGVNPYLTGGWAQFNTKANWLGNGEAKLNGWEAGAGLKIRLGGDNVSRRDFRLEIRDVMTDLQSGFANDGASTHNLIVTAGLQFGFGRGSKDGDLDGVRDREDLCPGTPAGAIVDISGCPSDSDGDGVLDGLDLCADTPAGATIDRHGCPKDSDGDGV